METKEQLIKEHADLEKLREKAHQRVDTLSPFRQFRLGQQVQVQIKEQYARYCSAIDAEMAILARMREIADKIGKLQK